MGAAASVAAAPFVDSGPITVAEFKAKGPVGVKIAFVKDFYREFKLTETTTVEDVIRDIIIPATAASNASYIATFLRNNENHYCKRSVSFKPEGDGMITTLTPECTEVLIFSWKMPFHMIVQHIERQLWIKWKNLIYNDDFYWLDIFCCNFHAPETVMEEMNGSLSRAKSALVLVWPEKTLVFNQASSCYLTWYAMENNFHVHFSASEYLGSPMEPDMIEPIDLSQTSSVQRTWIPLMEQALETSGTNLEELLSKVNQFVRNLVQANADKITDRGTVYGVNLAFITEFIRVNNITETMTTGEVVEKIIKPQTALTKETYLFSRLRDKPYFFADLSNGRTVNQRGNELESFAFLSHTWAMPFVHIVSLLHRSCKYVSMDGTQGFERSSFFWIDVFCKNQHIPAPAMDEFHKALTTPGITTLFFVNIFFC